MWIVSTSAPAFSFTVVNMNDKNNASAQKAGACNFCKGTGRVTFKESHAKCPKCKGTGSAPKITPKG